MKLRESIEKYLLDDILSNLTDKEIYTKIGLKTSEEVYEIILNSAIRGIKGELDE